MANVSFHYAGVALNILHKKELKTFIKMLFEREKITLCSLSYIFCSDEYLLKINRDFLNHNYYTDIITFNLSESKPVEGEVYISIERVKENAATLGIAFKEEVLRVIFHGALHLCGYNDKSENETLKMRNKENEYIHLYQHL